MNLPSPLPDTFDVVASQVDVAFDELKRRGRQIASIEVLKNPQRYRINLIPMRLEQKELIA